MYLILRLLRLVILKQLRDINVQDIQSHIDLFKELQQEFQEVEDKQEEHNQDNKQDVHQVFLRPPQRCLRECSTGNVVVDLLLLDDAVEHLLRHTW